MSKIPTTNSISKGLQKKWEENGYWFKKDYWGGEAITEHLISSLLISAGVQNVVKYLISGDFLDICKSEDFLAGSENLEFVTFHKLCVQYFSESEYNKFYNKKFYKDPFDKSFAFYADIIHRITEIDTNLIEEYLNIMFHIDSLFLNPDRHLRNFGFILLSNGSYKPSPLFDFGNSLLVEGGYCKNRSLNALIKMIDNRKGVTVSPFLYNSKTVAKYYKNTNLNIDLNLLFNLLDSRIIYFNEYKFFKALILENASENLKNAFITKSKLFESESDIKNRENLNILKLETLIDDVLKLKANLTIFSILDYCDENNLKLNGYELDFLKNKLNKSNNK